MPHLSPDGGAMPPPLCRSSLTRQIALRRARLADLEIEMIAACEAAALSERSPATAGIERGHWDRTTWHRYLAAAMRLEPTYGPRLRRLRQEIGQLERLLTLSIVA